HHQLLPSFPTRRSSDLPTCADASDFRYFACNCLACCRAVTSGGVELCTGFDSEAQPTTERANTMVANRLTIRIQDSSNMNNPMRSEEHTSELQSRFDLV